MRTFLYVAALKFKDESNTFEFVVGFEHEWVEASDEQDAYMLGHQQLAARKGDCDPQTGENILMNDYVVEV